MEKREEKCACCGNIITISDDQQLQTIEMKRFMRGVTQEYHYGKLCRECFNSITKMVKKFESS